MITWTTNCTNQSELVVYSNYNHFGVIHSDRKIGILPLREPVPVSACISMHCVGDCQKWTLRPTQLWEWACISVSLSSLCMPSKLKCFCFPDNFSETIGKARTASNHCRFAVNKSVLHVKNKNFAASPKVQNIGCVIFWQEWKVWFLCSFPWRIDK